MPFSPDDLCMNMLDGLQPEHPNPRKQAEETLLSYLRSMGDLPIVEAYEDARERCGWDS